ncbi:MAG: response regulator [Candidatus Binatota bacterium]
MFKILIIEDNDDNRDILKHQLEYLGYKVVEAADGLEGLNQVAKEQPDLVIVDIMMPGIDGKEVARRLRADSKTKDLPVLAATVLFHSEDIHSCLAAGCNDVLTKPFTLQQLKDRLEKLSQPAGRQK